MNITYIVLAIVYIFGYGTYALNQRKLSKENNTGIEVKRIDFKAETVDNKQNNSFDYCNHHYYTQQKTVVINKQKPLLKTTDFFYTFFVFDFGFRVNYNQQLPETTRPSPVC